uniref:BTB domain-containing protein n=1 Tax=Panagrolaimus davidi TaxID=227884 RepID=A0A914P983_9BILA
MLKLRNSNILYSEPFVNKILQERFKTFILQDPANEHFDVTFEIEGRKLYANKLILISASETMASMLSDRWKKKDEVVKIETYSYDNFYEFLRFIYTGGCNLTNENVFKLVDMAEFYAVQFLKELCHTFLLKMEYNVERIEEMVEFYEKYSLDSMKGALKVFVRCNLDKIVSRKRILSSGKLFVEFMSLNNQYSQKEKESVFEAVYKWTENQVLKQKDAEDENINLFEAVKDELSVAFPHIYAMDKSAMNYNFLMNFIVRKGFFLSPNELKILYERYRMNSLIEDICFRTVFNLAEKQALQRQKLASDGENFNLIDSIKADLSEVIKIAKFYQMQNSFLMDFVFAKGIITAEQARHVDDTRVSIKNNGKVIVGVFTDSLNILRAIEQKGKHCVYSIQSQSTTLLRLLELKFKVPITASKLMKMDGIEWYLCLDKNGILTFKHHSKVVENDYLLAEMKSEKKFSITPYTRTFISACVNNI